MRLLSWMAALALVAACASKPVEEKSVPITPIRGPKGRCTRTLQKAHRRLRPGLSAGNHDVKPGDDFFAYATARVYEGSHSADHAASVRSTRSMSSPRALRAIIEQAARHPCAGGTPEQHRRLLRGLHDEAAIEAMAWQPGQADLQRIAAANTRQALAHLFGEPGFVFRCRRAAAGRLQNPTLQCLHLPSDARPADRDYYLKDDPQLKALRGKYVAYIAQMLTLGGASDAAARARDIMAFETAGGQVPVADREAPRCGASTPAQQAAAARLPRPHFPGRRFSRPSNSAPAGSCAGRVRGHSYLGRASSTALRDDLRPPDVHYLSSHAIPAPAL